MTTFPFYPADQAGRFELYAAEYAFEQPEPTPWTPLRRDLRDCRAALVTTGGLRLNTQHEYSADRARGSAEWREISVYAHRGDLAFDFTNYDPREAEKDLNVIAPVDRLKELVDGKILGQINETFFSCFGLCTDIESLKISSRIAANRMREGCGVDVCFVVTANLVCNQTAGIVSREIEKAGISTVTLGTVREVLGQVKVPRPLFINFPFGRTLGRAHAVALQRSIVGDMVKTLRTHDRPGRMVELGYKWEGGVE